MGIIMSNKYIFDDYLSIIHALIGALAEVLSKLLPLIGALIIFTFVVYEVKEKDNPDNTLGDIIEFIIGWLIASSLTY